MKTIWILGASEGIGRALAILLSHKGYTLILSARNTDRLHTLVAELGKPHRVVGVDVNDTNAVIAASKRIVEEEPSVDTLIYACGYYVPLKATHMDIFQAEQMLNTNLIGAFRAVGSILPHFLEKNTGHIALIGSISGYRGLPGAIGYGASKAGIIHFAENLKCDLANTNIKVQVINPGFVKTRLTDLNSFSMPGIISPEKAAEYIFTGLQSNTFAYRFPFGFASFVKMLSWLPYGLYFWLLRNFLKNI